MIVGWSNPRREQGSYGGFRWDYAFRLGNVTTCIFGSFFIAQSGGSTSCLDLLSAWLLAFRDPGWEGPEGANVCLVP